MTIRHAVKGDVPAVAELALLLFPDHNPEELQEEMAEYIAGPDSAVLLAEEGSRAVGFAQCGLRHDYVEGTDSSPVGYLEGIYVREGFRRAKVASALVAAAEDWARMRGCREFASDCELDNTLSIAFHLGAGFTEANRLVCFVKEL